MMRHLSLLTIITVLLFIIAAGCGSKPTVNGETPAPAYEPGLSERAWQMMDSGAEFEEVLRVQQQAVNDLHQGKSKEDPVGVLEQMGYILFSKGRLNEAFQYFNEAEDSLRSRRWHAPTESEIMLYGDLSQFYERLGMVEQAISYSDSALVASRSMSGRLSPDLWRFRTQIFANNGRTTEAFACLDSASAAIRACGSPEDSAVMLAITNGERANLILSLNPGPDSITMAADLLKQARARLDDSEFIDYMGVTGYALYLTGEKTAGISLMEEAVKRLRDTGDLEMILMETRRLMDVYSAEGDDVKLSALHDQFTLLGDSMRRIHLNIDYVTKKARDTVISKHRENRLLREAVERQHRHKVVMISVSAILVLLLFALFILMNRRTRRIRYHRDKERARRVTAEADTALALSERDSALKRIETIKNEVHICPDSEVLERIKEVAGNFGSFQRTFESMYPGYITHLRTDFPLLTDTDVTFCMLIYLKYSSDDIAQTLNISRASVNSARYRIRTKLMLSRDVSLDKFLFARN